MVPYMMYGGAAAAGYTILFDILRHHDDTNLRPKLVDHTIALTLIGMAAGALTGKGGPKRMISFGIYSAFMLAPTTWWLKLQGLRPGDSKKPLNIFYTNDATPEEIERFQAQDMQEILTFNMSAKPGYGYFRNDMKHE